MENINFDIATASLKRAVRTFKKHAENLYEKNGEDYMKENMPGAWLLLQVLDATSY